MMGWGGQHKMFKYWFEELLNMETETEEWKDTMRKRVSKLGKRTEREDEKLAREVIEENKYTAEIWKTFPKEKQIKILTMQRDMMRTVANSISKVIKLLKDDK